MDPSINNILEPKEKVIWGGVINRGVLTTLLIISLAITFIIGGILLTMSSIKFTSSGQSKQVNGLLVGLAVMIIGTIVSLLGYFINKVKEYAITQKRVIIKSGIIGTDFKSVYFDQMKNVIVDVGIIGKIFKVGSIKIDIGKTATSSTGSYHSRKGIHYGGRVRTKTVYDTLRYIDQPYEVYKYLQKSLSGRKESLYSGRADKESNPENYK